MKKLNKNIANYISTEMNDVRFAQIMIDGILDTADEKYDPDTLERWNAKRVEAEANLFKLGINSATLTQAQVARANRYLAKHGLDLIEVAVEELAA